MRALKYHPRNVLIIFLLGIQEVMGIKALQAAQVVQELPLLGIGGWIMPSPETVRSVDNVSGTKLIHQQRPAVPECLHQPMASGLYGCRVMLSQWKGLFQA